MVDLSIIIPSIRIEKWPDIYKSVLSSFSNSFEIIFVGPYYNDWANSYKNVKYIKDWGTPVRCMQIALINAVGKVVTLLADDCLYEKNALNVSYSLLMSNQNDNNIVITKYTEGNDIIHNDDYYKLYLAYPFVNYTITERNYWIFNSALIYRTFLERIGGWNTNINTPAIAFAELALRAQRKQAVVHFYKEKLCYCGHMPNRTGDHAPIHDAHEIEDIPIYQYLYSINNPDPKLDDWKSTNPIWDRRFK